MAFWIYLPLREIHENKKQKKFYGNGTLKKKRRTLIVSRKIIILSSIDRKKSRTVKEGWNCRSFNGMS